MRGKVAESGKYITGRRLLRIFLPQAGDLIFSGSADVERGGIPDGKRQEGCAKCHKGGEAALEMRAARPYPSHRKMRIINSLQCYFDCLGVGGRQSVAQFFKCPLFYKGNSGEGYKSRNANARQAFVDAKCLRQVALICALSEVRWPITAQQELQ